MKHYILTILFAVITLSAFSQAKYNLLTEIGNYKYEQIRNKKYDTDFRTIFDSLKTYLSNDYALTSIAANGTIQGEAKENVKINKSKSFETRQYIKAEISKSRPYVVQFIKWKERRSVDLYTKQASDWKYIEQSANDMYVDLYEMIFGKIQLSADLQRKVDDYNSRQPDNRLRIFEGTDF